MGGEIPDCGSSSSKTIQTWPRQRARLKLDGHAVDWAASLAEAEDHLGAASYDLIRLAIAYNVLGSYAAARLPEGADGLIVELEDFTLTLLRTALIPQTAANPDLGAAFLDFLLSPEGQRLIEAETGLPAIDEDALAAGQHLRPIRLDPGLLVYVDPIKRQRFLAEWTAAVIQPYERRELRFSSRHNRGQRLTAGCRLRRLCSPLYGHASSEFNRRAYGEEAADRGAVSRCPAARCTRLDSGWVLRSEQLDFLEDHEPAAAIHAKTSEANWYRRPTGWTRPAAKSV